MSTDTHNANIGPTPNRMGRYELKDLQAGSYGLQSSQFLAKAQDESLKRLKGNGNNLSSAAKGFLIGVVMAGSVAASVFSPAFGSFASSVAGGVSSFVNKIDPAPAMTESEKAQMSESLKFARRDAFETLENYRSSIVNQGKINPELVAQVIFSINQATSADNILVRETGAKSDTLVSSLRNQAKSLGLNVDPGVRPTLYPGMNSQSAKPKL